MTRRVARIQGSCLARKAGAPRVASETPDLDELQHSAEALGSLVLLGDLRRAPPTGQERSQFAKSTSPRRTYAEHSDHAAGEIAGRLPAINHPRPRVLPLARRAEEHSFRSTDKDIEQRLWKIAWVRQPNEQRSRLSQ
jgi:hypothetical protein